MTGKPCQVTIPSAPGGARAPEEYKSERLTEKLDIFSTGHVLYAILTGRKPWDDLWGSQVKKLVKEGKKPPIVDKKYLQLGTSDAALANLIDLAYEFDPPRSTVSVHAVVDVQLIKSFRPHHVAPLEDSIGLCQGISSTGCTLNERGRRKRTK